MSTVAGAATGAIEPDESGVSAREAHVEATSPLRPSHNPQGEARVPRSRRIKTLVVMFAVLVVGSAFSSIGDYYHQVGGAIRYDDFAHFYNGQASASLVAKYPGPVDFMALPLHVRITRQIVVIIPFFMTVYFGLAVLFHLSERLVPRRGVDRGIRTQEGFRRVVENGLFFSFLYLLSGFGSGERMLLVAVFSVAWVVRLCYGPDRRFALVFSLLAGLAGPFYEGVVLDVPYWNPTIWGAAPWLFPMYMVGALGFASLHRYLLAAPAARPLDN